MLKNYLDILSQEMTGEAKKDRVARDKIFSVMELVVEGGSQTAWDAIQEARRLALIDRRIHLNYVVHPLLLYSRCLRDDTVFSNQKLHRSSVWENLFLIPLERPIEYNCLNVLLDEPLECAYLLKSLIYAYDVPKRFEQLFLSNKSWRETYLGYSFCVGVAFINGAFGNSPLYKIGKASFEHGKLKEIYFSKLGLLRSEVFRHLFEPFTFLKSRINPPQRFDGHKVDRDSLLDDINYESLDWPLLLKQKDENFIFSGDCYAPDDHELNIFCNFDQENYDEIPVEWFYKNTSRDKGAFSPYLQFYNSLDRWLINADILNAINTEARINLIKPAILLKSNGAIEQQSWLVQDCMKRKQSFTRIGCHLIAAAVCQRKLLMKLIHQNTVSYYDRQDYWNSGYNVYKDGRLPLFFEMTEVMEKVEDLFRAEDIFYSNLDSFEQNDALKPYLQNYADVPCEHSSSFDEKLWVST